MNKIISYIGFAIKSNKVVLGQGQLKHYKGQINLILVSGDSSDNLIDLAKNISNKHNCNYIVTKQPLENLTNIQNLKIIGITDPNLSNAIILNKESISIG